MASATLTISDAVFPQRTLARDCSLILGGVALTALCAQVSIPWHGVPLTLQTLAVYLVGITLGSKRGVLTMLTYLAAGMVGLPVLARGVVGTLTFGYLVGFVAAVWILGMLAERGWDRSPLSLAAGMVIAEITVLTLGTLWLAQTIGFAQAIAVGVVPFLIPEAIKMVAVSALLPGAWRFLGSRS